MSDQTPLVSIILPTYKRAHVLPYAINSVLAQTYQNFELIIVDDNSPDNTREVVEAFTDPRIRYTCNNPNLRLPRALNRGFSLSKGEYLTWTSDDNLFAPTAIERMVAELKKTGRHFVYADYYQFGEADEQQQPLDAKAIAQPSKLQLEKGNHIGACFMYSRTLYETIGDYDPELFLVEDYDYFIRAAKTFEFCHIAEPLYYFRRDDDTLYYSRFCEVKASDILVRFKNGLIAEQQVIDFLVQLISNNVDSLKSGLLPRLYKLFKPVSYRLSTTIRARCIAEVRDKIQNNLFSLLQQFSDKKITFGEARDQIVEIIKRLADVKPT